MSEKYNHTPNRPIYIYKYTQTLFALFPYQELPLVMEQSIPKTSKQWSLAGQNGFESLKFTEEPVPELDDNHVLVKSKFIMLSFSHLEEQAAE